MQEKLAQASADEAAYKKALPKELRSLVCASDADAIHTLRGIIENARLQATEDEGPPLVDFFMSKDCPVYAALTDDDKEKLLEIKQRTEHEAGPSSSAEESEVNELSWPQILPWSSTAGWSVTRRVVPK